MDYLVEAKVAVLWKKNIAPQSNHFKRVLKKHRHFLERVPGSVKK